MKAAPAPLVIVAPRDPGFPDIDDIVALGDLNKATLGLLPRSAFRQYWQSGTVLAAISAGKLIGYTVFADRKTYRDIKLIHLCVASEARRRGVASKLIEAIILRHPNVTGLAAYCRRDYAENAIWPRLHFTPRGERPARKDGAVITGWFRSYGHPDLFAPPPDARRLIVAIDTNILTDLVLPENRTGASDSAVLQADWMQEEIELVITQAVSVEANQTQDRRLRHRLLSEAARMRTLHSDPLEASEIHKRLLLSIPDYLLAADPTLKKDSLVVAQAMAGGAELLATRDGPAINALQTAIDPLSEFQVVHPTEISAHLDRIRQTISYQPVRLFGTGYSAHFARGNESSELSKLINMPSGERRNSFNRKLINAGHNPRRGLLQTIVRSPEDDLVAAFTHQIVDVELLVPFLRVGMSRVRNTLARQIVHHLRRLATTGRCSRVVIADEMISEATVSALSDDGYDRVGDTWRAFTMPIIAPYQRIVEQVNSDSQSDGGHCINFPALPDLSAQDASALEARLWPAKIADAPLTTYIVPIKEQYAVELLDTQATLTDGDPRLGLAKERIYYRTPAAIEVHAPGRILWYETRRQSAGSLVACSRLIATQRDSPECLHREFGRFGVWSLAQIRAASRCNIAEALHFADTEVFDKPIPWARLARKAPALGTIQSPRTVSADLFVWIYQEGKPS